MNNFIDVDNFIEIIEDFVNSAGGAWEMDLDDYSQCVKDQKSFRHIFLNATLRVRHSRKHGETGWTQKIILFLNKEEVHQEEDFVNDIDRLVNGESGLIIC